jgi:uncharacterized protein with HEPN domain
MLIAAGEVSGFLSGKTRADLDTERMLVRAMLHAVLEIGEAAANLSDEGRLRVPGVPWADVVRMRNILVHAYWGINLDKLWETAQTDLPELVRAIRSSLSGWPLELD